MKEYNKPFIEDEIIEIEDIIADSPGPSKDANDPDLTDPFNFD